MWNNGTASSSKSSSDNHQHPHRQEKSSLIQIAHHHYHHRYQDHYDTHDFKTKGPLQQQQQQVDHDKNITSHAGSSSTRSRISNGIINNRNNIPLYSNNTVMGRPFSTHHTTSPPKGSKPIKGRPIQQHRIVKKKKSPGKGVVGGSGGGGGGGGREIDNPKTLNETEINYSTATSSTTSTQRKTTRDSIQIFTDRQDDGFSNFVMKTQSVQFKVHRPGCSCTKIQNVMRSIQEENNPKSTPPTDGSGFIILPNSNTLKNIFVGGRVTSHAYLQDPLVHESDLWDILRPLPQSIYGTIIKLVCAQCMLQVVPNGFVCLSSPSRSLVEDARDMALRAKEQTLESKNVLHSDHADYICVLGLHALKRYYASSSHQRRRSYEKKYNNNLNGLHNMNQDEQQYLILKELLDQNIPVDKSPNNVNLKIGHHLKCIFNFFQGEERDRFVMITVVQTHKQDGTGTVLEMDVPGGKRHLGESSLECAFRETREETSLAMEKSWLLEDGRPLKSSSADESFNAFYQVLPPRIREKKDAALDDILSNVFWTNTGLRS